MRRKKLMSQNVCVCLERERLFAEGAKSSERGANAAAGRGGKVQRV